MARNASTENAESSSARRPVARRRGDERAADDATKSHATLSDAAELVPGWLALLVLILLLAVSALGGYLIRGAILDSRATTPAEYAVQDLEEEVAQDPDNIENQLALGYAYQQEAKYDEALAQYEKVLTEDPGNTGALYNKGIVLMETDRNTEAEAVFWDLLDVAPDHVLAAKALGEYYVEKKHYKSALVALEPVIKLQPEYSDLQYLAAYSCEMLGLKESAIEYYRGALKYNPDHVEAKDGLNRLGAAQ